MFFKIALLNMFKHLKRTLLILFCVMVSVLVMEFMSGMLSGMKENSFENLLQESGHLQVHHHSYEDRLNPLSIQYTIGKPDHLISIIKEDAAVARAEKIIHFAGLLIKDDKNMALTAHGLMADTAWYAKVTENMVEGSFDVSDFGAIVSDDLARVLDAELGDTVDLLVEDREGIVSYWGFTIRGIFDTGGRTFDTTNIFISHAAADEILYLQGETVEIRVNLTDPQKAVATKERLAGALDEAPVIIETWIDIHGSWISLIKIMDFFIFFINIIVILIAATVITNAILMNVFERFSEFGTMRSIGMKRHQLFGMIMWEGLIEGITGSLAGLAIGIPLVLYFTANGMDLGQTTEVFNVGSGARFYFNYNPHYSLINFAFGSCIAAVGSMYAAAVAVRMKLVSIMRA